jgi:hypothetical protein
MEEKVNYSTTLCSEQTVHDVCCCTVHCSELWFVLTVNWNKTVNGYNKTKAASHSEMQNVMSSTYIDGFTVNTTTQDICNCQNKNETNTTTTFTNEHDKL